MRFAKKAAIVIAIVVAVGWIGIGVYLRDEAVRQRIVEALATELDADVVLESLDVDVFPTVRITGTGLRIHRNQDPHSFPPFIVVRRFEVVPGLWHVIRGRAQLVELEGFRFTVPRDPKDQSDQMDQSDQSDPTAPVLSRVVALDAELVYTPKDLKGPIRAFPIRELELLEVGFDRAMDYHAVVTNPQPKGRFESRGSFGPLRPSAPGASPLSGAFTLTEADFNTIKGLAGTVDVKGDFTGALAELHVDGSTATPNFEIDEGGHPVPLTTEFIATVDCTSGDLHLSEVQGKLAESNFTASGSITGSPGAKGRRVDLEFSMPDGRAEDALRLVVPSREPIVVGRVTLDAHFLLPHGDGSAVSRMEVTGRMRVRDAHLGPDAAQARIDDLSRRAQGKPDDAPVAQAPLDVDGEFTLMDSVARFSELTFSAPGATVSLVGTYGVAEGALDMKGEARLDATLGNLADGVKGFLLTLVSPLFKKDGAGAVVPIRVTGTHDKPDVGLDVGRAIKGKRP